MKIKKIEKWKPKISSAKRNDCNNLLSCIGCHQYSTNPQDRRKKQEEKQKLIYYVWNKNWTSMSASSLRISSSQQRFLLAVYLIDLFNGVATWKRITQS